MKNGTFYVELLWILFIKRLEKIGQHFTPASVVPDLKIPHIKTLEL